MKIYRFIYGLLILCCCNYRAYCQSGNQDQTPPSPNAAALGIFSQYPQSSFTGVPAINIPVYDFSYGELSLPIQLSYNPNLVKPFHNGSWVGLGFNLTAGGCITRVVNDKPDESTWISLMVTDTHELQTGFFYNHSFMATSNWASTTNLTNAIGDLNNYGLKNIVQNYGGYSIVKDYAPDEFSFNIGDLSGTFYMDESGNFKVRCTQKVKVIIGSSDFISVPYSVPSLPGGPVTTYPDRRYLNRITLIDSKGVQYVFGGAANSVEIGDLCPKTWYITSITTSNGKTISYNYQAGQTVTYNLPGYYGTYADGSGGRVLFQDPGPLVNSKYLKEIRTDDQVISFFSSYNNANEFSKLDSIKVNSLVNGSQVRNYVFNYINNPMDRLKLVSFYEKDINNQHNNTYTFTYNPLQFITTQLNTDHWGYNTYNSVNGSSYSSFVNSRGADTLHCRAELLNNIIYPTGGYSNYAWEPNSYSSVVDDNRTNLINYATNGVAGGVRIKQVTDYDNNNVRIGHKRYAYIKNYSPTDQANVSSGVLYAQPSYSVAHNVQIPVGSVFTSIDYSFSAYLPLMDDNTGSHIAYSEVTEINMDRSYTINDYSNFDTGINGEYMDVQPDNYIYSSGVNTNKLFTSNSHERGKLLRERNYSNNSILVSDNITTYQRINKTNEFVKTYAVDHYTTYVPPSGQYLDFFQGTAYRIYTNAYLPLTQSETQYDPNGLSPLTKTTNYTYDPTTLNLVTTIENNSKGQLVETDNAYATDMISGGNPPSEAYLMQTANDISDIFETKKKINYNQVSLNHYDYYAVTSTVFRPITQYSQFGANTPTLPVTMFYDINGNLTNKFKQYGPTTSFIYGYSNNLPIAKIENAASNACFYEDFETTGTYGIAHTGHRYNDGAYNCVVNYSPNMKLTYWYRVNNVWNYAVETYTGPHAILPTGADAIDDVMLYPDTAQMSVFTYDPLVGMTSSTDAKGYTTTYEYDNFNRLRNVKDKNGDIIRSLCYNLAGQPGGCALNTVFYSASKSGNFYDNACGAGYLGSIVTYTIPAGKYLSTLSQADADQKAKTELQINGQAFANKTGSCAIGAIYARVEIQNVQTITDANITQASADVYIRFYGDQNCQTPVALRSSMDFSYDINYQGNGNYPSDQYITLTADSSATEINLGNWQVLYKGNTDSVFSLFKFSVITNTSGAYSPLGTVGDTYTSLYQN